MASELFGFHTGLRIPALTGVVLQVCISVQSHALNINDPLLARSSKPISRVI
jgi:hypothetical protein